MTSLVHVHARGNWKCSTTHVRRTSCCSVHEQDGQCIKMAVAQHDSFLPSKEYSVKRELKESGRPPPFHIASLLSTSPPPEKSDESCADTVHHKPVPGPSGSGEVLGGTVDYSYGCQCGDAGRPHSARCASCGVPFRTAVITHLPLACMLMQYVDMFFFQFFQARHAAVCFTNRQVFSLLLLCSLPPSLLILSTILLPPITFITSFQMKLPSHLQFLLLQGNWRACPPLLSRYLNVTLEPHTQTINCKL